MSGNETKVTRPLGQTPEATEDPWLGRVIDGRYVITERLGEGGMGAVFAAEHRQLKKPVALKVILSQFAGNDEIAARFAREAMASAHIEHPNVCATLDYGSLPEGGSYLVMQLVRGPSLRAHLSAQGVLPWREACEITAQIADAVCAAHAAGIIHRDLKPENVVLIPNELGPPTAKVLDFGIAHVKAHNQAPPALAAGLTRAGMIIGTPGYMPPEQATGQAVDESADLYALGVILWELLMGRQPFEGENFSEIVMQQLKHAPPTLNLSLTSGCPEELTSLVQRLLAPSPLGRPTSAAQVRDTLRALTVTPANLATQKTVAAPSSAHSIGSTLPTTWLATRKRFPAGARWALVLSFVLAVTGTFTWFRQTATPADVAPETATTTSPPASAPDRAAEKPQKKSPAAAPAPLPTTASEKADDATREREEATEQKPAARRKPSRKSSEKPRPVQRIKRALNELLR